MNKPLIISLVQSFLEELKFPHIPTSYYIFSFSKILRTTHEKSNRILRKVRRQTRKEGHSQNTKKNIFCTIPNLEPFKLAGLKTPHAVHNFDRRNYSNQIMKSDAKQKQSVQLLKYH